MAIPTVLGFGLSLAPAQCLGLYVLPRRLSAPDPWVFSARMGRAVLVLGGVLWLARAATWSPIWTGGFLAAPVRSRRADGPWGCRCCAGRCGLRHPA